MAATAVVAAVAKIAMPIAIGASACDAAAEEEQAEARRLDDGEEAADDSGGRNPQNGVKGPGLWRRSGCGRGHDGG